MLHMRDRQTDRESERQRQTGRQIDRNKGNVKHKSNRRKEDTVFFFLVIRSYKET